MQKKKKRFLQNQRMQFMKNIFKKRNIFIKLNNQMKKTKDLDLKLVISSKIMNPTSCKYPKPAYSFMSK